MDIKNRRMGTLPDVCRSLSFMYSRFYKTPGPLGPSFSCSLYKAHHFMKVISDFQNFCFAAATQQRLPLFESPSLILSDCQSGAQNSMTDKGATKPKEMLYQQQPAECVDPVCISEQILTTP